MSVKRRLLVLTSTFPKSPTDGTPSFVLDIAREHAKHFDVWVITPMVTGAKRCEVVDDVKVTRFHYLWPLVENVADGSIMDNIKKNKYQMLQVPFLIVSFCCEFLFRVLIWRPDACHAHWILPGGLVAKLAPWVPTIITAHGGDVYGLNGRTIGRLKNWILADSVVTTVSHDMRQSLIDSGLSRDARVIPMGVRLQIVEEVKTPKQVVFVGRLVEKKGLEYLLEAVKGVDCQLVVIGDGPLRLKLEGAAPKNAVFLGQISKRKVMRTVAESEIMVIPSIVAENGDREGLPVTLMEAAVCKTAVVASNISGINEVVVHNESGLLVQERDSVAISNAVVYLLADPKVRGALADSLHQRAGDFNVELVAAKYRSVIEGVMS